MTDSPEVVRSVAGLERRHGRLAIAVGVFDGLHRGHAHLLAALVKQAAQWRSRPAVVTFDAHPDAVIRGEAPPLLLDPAERERLLGEAGVVVIVVEHFDDRLRHTPYDEFVRSIASRVDLAGFVMTPDTAFGFERRGTPAALTAMGAASRPPFDVAVIEPLRLKDGTVSSSDIRRLVAGGEFGAAEALLGRPYYVVGQRDGSTERITFPLPVALPATSTYAGSIGGREVSIDIPGDGSLVVRPLPPSSGPLTVTFHARYA
jgi:riboflavin kinase/FMN adenylyltransferase